ncbi:RHS repeat-associated core domain-containing protein [Flavobacterium sp. CF136]|uniref:RHS repeat-associated core domain-containing protein n=1 Tax=Flavobacterium sp. (strain CF136) TaxID=1144313 RepID=UPI000271A79E|nr:RHS repeat-associated core domain-containing protein [Flavobacterium sp. CF136]EJL65540.1 RHS repeat-associated core domain protein-containing protein [Flavobacterium sp. CF136]
MGNIRLSYDKTLAIKEESNYYPFGLKQEGYNNVKSGVENKYKYNGKELQDELGLNITAMDYRQYDNALGRFNSIDAMSEKFPALSPYSFSANNPILLNDPSGKDWSISATVDKSGKLHVKITVNAAIINTSGKKINMKNYIKNETAQFNRIFSMNRENFDVTANLNMREIKDEDDATKSEHLIKIKDSNHFKKNSAGNSHLGGLNVNINSEFIDSDGSTPYNATLSHEIGHTGGLNHPGEKNLTGRIGINHFFGRYWGEFIVPTYNQNEADLRTNFMSYPQDYIDSDTQKGMQELIKVYQNPGVATRGQISSILRYYSSSYRFINNDDK